MQTQSKCSHVVQTPLQISPVQAGMEVGFPLSSCNNFHSRVTRTPRSEIILHNAGRRTHLTKIAGAHQGKISGLCWADDHRVLSCGVDRNIKMWDVRAEASLDSSGAGPSQVRFSFFSIFDVFRHSRSQNLLRFFQGKEHFSRPPYSLRFAETDTAFL
jgi:hypothetical protein